jgi:hypothetical protein
VPDVRLGVLLWSQATERWIGQTKPMVDGA